MGGGAVEIAGAEDLEGRCGSGRSRSRPPGPRGFGGRRLDRAGAGAGTGAESGLPAPVLRFTAPRDGVGVAATGRRSGVEAALPEPGPGPAGASAVSPGRGRLKVASHHHPAKPISAAATSDPRATPATAAAGNVGLFWPRFGDVSPRHPRRTRPGRVLGVEGQTGTEGPERAAARFAVEGIALLSGRTRPGRARTGCGGRAALQASGASSGREFPAPLPRRQGELVGGGRGQRPTRSAGRAVRRRPRRG
jgi:hypothetical protein